MTNNRNELPRDLESSVWNQSNSFSIFALAVSYFLNNVVFLSAKEGFGIEDLESKVSNAFESGLSSVEGDAYFVSSRQSEALKHAVEAMERVKESALNDLPVDFWTIDLREAAVALGEVTGEDVSEDILGTIFERFCIGK